MTTPQSSATETGTQQPPPQGDDGEGVSEDQPAETQDKTRTGDDKPVPVVALGASAGGLDALNRFFSAWHERTGMAFVVIQHLAPDSKSMLAELLQGHIKGDAEVVEVQDGMPIEADRVHVIPPNRFLTVDGGQLHLHPVSSAPRLPIDYFLRSMAADRHDCASVAILSGTGSDGMLGAKAIRGENGLVLAQEPGTAEYDGMPRSIIDHDLADFVLAPEAMLERLLEHTRRAAPWHSQSKDSAKGRRSEHIQVILNLLYQHGGHDFSLYKTSTLLRRIERRMAVHDVDDPGEYARLLRAQPAELDSLFRELLIRVTSFFRDSETFDALESHVVPQLFAGDDDDETLRIWVPGCSTGEEAYSIAILLQEWKERQRRARPVQIFATDIDSAALQTARDACYPTNIVQDLSQERLERFFTQYGEAHYQVRKSIRDMVLFAEHSVVKDPPFSRLGLVSCRNLLMYMNSELQGRVLPLLHYALNPGGYLLLGSSESVGRAGDLFRVVEAGKRIFQRQEVASYNLRGQGMPTFLAPRSEVRSSRTTGSRAEAPNIAELAGRMLLRDHTPAGVIINGMDEITYFNGDTGPFLGPPPGKPSMELMHLLRKEVASEVRSLVRQARTQWQTVQGDIRPLPGNHESGSVRFVVSPIDDPQMPGGSLFVLMETAVVSADGMQQSTASSDTEGERVDALESDLARKEAALQATVEELETSNEELQSSNEELQSSNEELQSSNEELETSREELRAVNEELQSVNGELENKVAELAAVRDDLNNLLASSAIGIIFLDGEQQIQRYTPAVTGIIPLIESDIGRPLNDIGHKLDYERLSEDIDGVLKTGDSREREIRAIDGRQYLTRISPYRISDREIRGTVVVFIDLSDREYLASLNRLRTAMDQLPGMLAILDLDGRIDYVAGAFASAAGWELEALLGQSAAAIGLDDLADTDGEIMRSIRSGRPWHDPIRYRRGEDDVVEVRALVTPMCSGSESPAHVLVYIDEPTASE